MKVFVARKIPQAGIDLLRKENFDVKVYQGEEPIKEKELIKNAKDADALLSLLSERISAQIMDEMPKLKIISNYAVGYNNINVPAATERCIAVTNTPGVLTNATADTTLALLLATSRRIIEADKYMRNGKFTGWKPMLFLGSDLNEKTLGIIGLGRIGKAVAQRAKAFGMKIIYYDTTASDNKEYKKVSLKQLLTKSDYISIHTPLDNNTHHLLRKPELSLMKPSSIIINTARGEIVDEKVLIEFLRKKKIAYAGFDVYEGEPIVNKELFKLENVVILPHIGSATKETRDKMSIIAAKNIIDALKGKKPKFIINPEIYLKKNDSDCCQGCGCHTLIERE